MVIVTYHLNNNFFSCILSVELASSPCKCTLEFGIHGLIFLFFPKVLSWLVVSVSVHCDLLVFIKYAFVCFLRSNLASGGLCTLLLTWYTYIFCLLR